MRADSPGAAPRAMALAALVLGVTSAVRLGSTLYLPALPALGRDLHIELGMLSTTLTVFFGFFAVATLVAGPVVDSWGRRVVVRWGLVLFALGSLLCGLADAAAPLLAGRALQAVGAGFIPVAGRVILRDAYDDDQVMKVLSWLGILGSLIPIVSPILGGFIVQGSGWRATFHLLTVLTALAIWATWRALPETLASPQPLHLRGALQGYWAMARSARFVRVMAPISLCFVIQGVFFATAPHIFVSRFGMKPSDFGLANLVLVLALLCGRTVSAALVKRLPLYTLYLGSAGLAMAGGAAIVAFLAAGVVGPASLLTATALFCLGFGGLLPIGMRSLLTGWGAQSGLASALFGCCTIGAMALGSSAVSLLGLYVHDTLWVLALLALALGGLTPLCAATTRRLLV